MQPLIKTVTLSPDIVTISPLDVQAKQQGPEAMQTLCHTAISASVAALRHGERLLTWTQPDFAPLELRSVSASCCIPAPNTVDPCIQVCPPPTKLQPPCSACAQTKASGHGIDLVERCDVVQHEPPGETQASTWSRLQKQHYWERIRATGDR